MSGWSDTEIQNLVASWKPSSQQINREVSSYLGNYQNQFLQRTRTTVMMHTTYFFSHYVWRISGLMLMGMAAFKSGFLLGKMSASFYKSVLLFGGLIGTALVIYGVIQNFSNNWSITYSMFIGSQYNYWGSLGMALAYISGLVLLSASKYINGLKVRLAAIGRTALSNYMMQSIICASIFYGGGFFGRVDRIHQLLIVVGIWLFQLHISPKWVKRFRYGPMEWVWRSLTYGKLKSNKKKPAYNSFESKP